MYLSIRRPYVVHVSFLDGVLIAVPVSILGRVLYAVHGFDALLLHLGLENGHEVMHQQ